MPKAQTRAKRAQTRYEFVIKKERKELDNGLTK
jgi:hypothetical protein